MLTCMPWFVFKTNQMISTYLSDDNDHPIHITFISVIVRNPSGHPLDDAVGARPLTEDVCGCVIVHVARIAPRNL